jgi:AmmeMemoRadiSam system protein A
MLLEQQKQFLLELAEESIVSVFDKRELNLTVPEEEVFATKCGGFVTLNKNGNLRGCIGYIRAYKPLYITITEMARAAAFEDPRFPSLEQVEMDEIDIEISVLSELVSVTDFSKIEVGKHGLYVKNRFASGLLLPQVATEWRWDSSIFLEQTCLKAGLNKNSWKKPETEVYKFTAEIFSNRQKK